MTAERKPSEIADELERLSTALAFVKTDEQLTEARKNLSLAIAPHFDTIIAALRSAAPPRGEPVHDGAEMLAGIIENVTKESHAETVRDVIALNAPALARIIREWRAMYDAAPSAGRDTERVVELEHALLEAASIGLSTILVRCPPPRSKYIDAKFERLRELHKMSGKAWDRNGAEAAEREGSRG